MFQIILFSLGVAFPSDSLRMETINGKPFVVHQVDEKETLYSIARRYGASITDVLAQNPTADGGLEVGQILKIPYAPRGKGQAPVTTADGIVHKVAAKETLFSIARLYNVSVDDIKTWNNLKDNSLSLGQDIIIKKKSVVDTPVTEPVATAAKTHTVAAKETLYSIAKQYGMTVAQLKEWNNIKDNELKIGQVLTVAAPVVSTPVVTTNIAVVTDIPIPTTTESTVTTSEGVRGTDEIKEIGLAELITSSDINRKYLAQHHSVKPGTILKIRNLATNQEVFVRVTGPLPAEDASTMIRISKSAYDRLGASEPSFRAEITYYK